MKQSVPDRYSARNVIPHTYRQWHHAMY